MTHSRIYSAAFGLVMLASPFAVSAAGWLTCVGGDTLYTYDLDVDGTSACDAECIKQWPPYYHASGNEEGEMWTVVTNADGTKQWAYDGKPVYYFIGDTKTGEANGDGIGGVWHIIKQ